MGCCCLCLPFDATFFGNWKGIKRPKGIGRHHNSQIHGINMGAVVCVFVRMHVHDACAQTHNSSELI